MYSILIETYTIVLEYNRGEAMIAILVLLFISCSQRLDHSKLSKMTVEFFPFRDFVPGKAEKNQVHYDPSTEPNFDTMGEDNVIANMTCFCVVGIEVGAPGGSSFFQDVSDDSILLLSLTHSILQGQFWPPNY